MAQPPVAAPAADDAELPPDDAAAMPDDTADESEVLLTVCKEADGSYTLIKGDEQEADGEDAAGAAATEGTPEEAGKQSFDNPGALLKAILDILNEDESAAGADGSSEDQFQAGYSGAAAAPAAASAPAAPMAQKY